MAFMQKAKYVKKERKKKYYKINNHFTYRKLKQKDSQMRNATQSWHFFSKMVHKVGGFDGWCHGA